MTIITQGASPTPMIIPPDFATHGGTVSGPVIFNDTITLAKGSQDYLFTDRSVFLAIQSQTSNISTAIEMFTKDGDGVGGEQVYIDFYGIGTPAGIDPMEKLHVGFNANTDVGEIYTAHTNSTLRPLVLYTEGNANQLYLATDGKVGINTALPNYQLEIVKDAADATFALTAYHDTEATTSRIRMRKAEGTEASHATPVDDDAVLGLILLEGYDGNSWVQGVGIRGIINGTPADEDMPTDLEIYTNAGAGATSLSAVIGKDAMLDLYGGTISILAGADSNLKTRGATSRKLMRFAVPHYTLSESPMAVMLADADNGTNNLTIGGGTSTMNAITTLAINVADNSTTHTGTEVARFQGGATKARMMGLGNSSLKGWHQDWSALQLGGTGSIFGQTSESAGSSIRSGENLYYDGDFKYAVTDMASRYEQYAGTHNFVVVTSGTLNTSTSGNETIALTIANDASSLFGNTVSINNGASATSGLHLSHTGASATEGVNFYYDNSGAGTTYLDNIIDGASSALKIRMRSAGTPLEVLTFSGDGSSTFGGDVTANPVSNAASLWLKDTNTGIARNAADGSTDIYAGGVAKANFVGGANGLITLSGGTGGVRLDNTVGIGAEPSATITLRTDRTFTAGGGSNGVMVDLSDQITGVANNSIFGLNIAGTYTLPASGTSPIVADINLTGKALGADTGATVGILSTLYVASAPSYSGTATNGPYSIFVDAGLSRFDGDGTNVFELPADATDPTGGGGAAAGRIPVDIGGVTKYIPYY